MIKKSLIFILVFSAFCQVSTSAVRAGVDCDPNNDTCKTIAGPGYFCEPDPADSTRHPFCQKDPFKENFGKIKPPPAIKTFIDQGQTGAGGISMFLNNLITLFYSIAAIVLIFMLLWGAFEWITSGGDKEAIAKARGRIIHAFIGILLFAVTFAVIRVLGTFTGFTFFEGQNTTKTTTPVTRPPI